MEVRSAAQNRKRKRGAFAHKGSNFFVRPEEGKLNEEVWRVDRDLLEREHRALCQVAARALGTPEEKKVLRQLCGVVFHDLYHAGQIRLLRSLMEAQT